MDTRRTDRLLLLVLLVLLARQAWLASFIHPYADDLNYAAVGMEGPLAERLVVEYRTWNGRWSTNPAVLRGPLTWAPAPSLGWYRAMPAFFILLTICSAFFLLRTMLKDATDSTRMWLGATGFTSIYLNLMPHLGQGIHWYTGAVTYQAASALMLVHVAAVIRMRGATRQRSLWTALGTATLLFIAGANEVSMMLVVAFHALLVLMRWRSGARVQALSVALLSIAVLAGAMMAAAPGNAVREEHFPARHDPFLTGVWSMLQTGRFGSAWVFSPIMLVATLLVMPAIRDLASRSRDLASLLAIPVRHWSLITFGMLFLVMALPYWTTGLLGQHRTVNVALFFFIPLWLLTVGAFDAQVLLRRGWRLPLSRAWGRRVLMMLAIALLTYAGNDRRVMDDLFSGRAVRYDMRMRERYALIREGMARGAEQVVVPALHDVPLSLAPLDAGPDPGHWMNRGLAAWMGDPELRIVVAGE